MKLILIHAETTTRNHLVHHLNELNHVVVAEPLDPGALLTAIAKHQPHAVIACQLPQAFDEEALSDVGSRTPQVSIVHFTDDGSEESLRERLVQALENVAELQKTKKAQPYTSGQQRLVLHDIRYVPFAQKEKLGVSSTDLSDQKRETDLFTRQINCALKNHGAARRYLAQLLKTDRGLQTECAYRFVHASYKVFWLREHALRFVGVLAHYIEGVEIEYLPAPAPPSTTLDYVHYDPPSESLYAAVALIGHGFRPRLLPGFRAILGVKFTGQTEEQLYAEAILLSGWCAVLREVARAQVRFMDEILNNKSDWNADRRPSRRNRRAEGIYGDFWFLPWLRQNPERMQEIARLATGEWISPTSPSHFITPYRDFLRAHHAGLNHTTNEEEAQ